MKCEIIVDRDCEERVVIYTREENTLVREIQQLLQRQTGELLGFQDREAVKLDPSDIYYITIVDGKVCAVCEQTTYVLKERLYTLEERLPRFFVKIHQSCLANLKKAERFDASIAGTLKIRFKNGDVDYVSRRQLKAVKERLGI
ncbi:MAG: LytTR family transcriptional regulator [Ruminococcaceae bacterium]|nr:LytTR family transcriptional regulator [Oscillospiraceae bacterium]